MPFFLRVDRIFNSVVLNSGKCYSIHHWTFPKIEWNCLCRFRLRTKHYSWNCKFLYSDFPNFIVTIFISTTELYTSPVYLISSFVPPFHFILLIWRTFLFIAKFCCMKAVAICLRKLTQYTTSKQRMILFLKIITKKGIKKPRNELNKQFSTPLSRSTTHSMNLGAQIVFNFASVQIIYAFIPTSTANCFLIIYGKPYDYRISVNSNSDLQ